MFFQDKLTLFFTIHTHLSNFNINVSSCCCCSVIKSCPTFCDPMDCSMPGFLVLHYLLEFAQISCSLSWWCYLTISSSVALCFFCSFSSVAQLCLKTLWPHGLQHARLPCSSPTPGACSHSCPWSWWCHPTISSSVIPFSSCLQSFPAWGCFPMTQLFASDGQNTGALASASVLPKNIQDWFPLGWTGWMSFQSKGLSKVFSDTTVQKHQFFCAQLSLQSNIHIHIHIWLLEKPQLWLDGPLSAK